MEKNTPNIHETNKFQGPNRYFRWVKNCSWNYNNLPKSNNSKLSFNLSIDSSWIFQNFLWGKRRAWKFLQKTNVNFKDFSSRICVHSKGLLIKIIERWKIKVDLLLSAQDRIYLEIYHNPHSHAQSRCPKYSST